MFNTCEIMLGRPRCRNWIPLLTQQLRLRHLIQVIGYNIKVSGGSFYYTLHSTTMCAPFYTSEKIESVNPKWGELDINILQNSPASGFVLRIWQHVSDDVPDKIVLTWGIYLSGLVYMGTKLSDIQPTAFKDNTVIFQLNGGYYTSYDCLMTTSPKPLPFVDNLNIGKEENKSNIVRYESVKCAKNEIRKSYNVKKLQKLQSLQQSIKNKTLDAQALREKINAKTGMGDTPCTADSLHESSSPTSSSYEPNYLSLPSLHTIMNRQDQPTRFQRQQIAKQKRLIEIAKFRTKMLSQERDRKLANLRHLKQKCTTLMDNNEDKSSELMSLYRQLSRDIERLRGWRRSQTDTHELYVHTAAQLHLRRKQLIKQLLLIYPIEKESEDKYTITGVHLPDSECLNSVPENSLSVALGYVSHAVVMCSTFLQVPLRYPLTHLGARSKITDHITQNMPDKEREFPLYTRGKERLQFQYAIYLLNKNIAQLRWYCNLPTQDLRATLPNLFSLLQGCSDYKYDRPDSGFISVRCLSSVPIEMRSDPMKHMMNKYGSLSTLDPSLSSPTDRIDKSHFSNSLEQIFSSNFRQNSTNTTPVKKSPKINNSESGPGLGQFLSSPGDYFKNSNVQLRTKPELFVENDESNKDSSNCDNIEVVEKKADYVLPAGCVDCNIEQGLDMLDASHNLKCSSKNEHSFHEDTNISNEVTTTISPLPINILQRRISRSVGSYTDDEKTDLGQSNLEVGSDPLLIASVQGSEINLSDQSLSNSLGEGRKEFLQQWFNNTSSHICSEENLCSQFSSSVDQESEEEVTTENTLTKRTEALVQKGTTFHLVKPRH